MEIRTKMGGIRKQLRLTHRDDINATHRLLSETVQALAKDTRQRAWLLVEQLDQHKFMFNPKGEFIPCGQAIPIEGSHVKDLLNYYLSTRLSCEPAGFKEFSEQLGPLPLHTIPEKRVRHKRTKKRTAAEQAVANATDDKKDEN